MRQALKVGPSMKRGGETLRVSMERKYHEQENLVACGKGHKIEDWGGALVGGTYGHVIPRGTSVLPQTRRWTVREKTKVVSYKGFCSFYTENGHKRQLVKPTIYSVLSCMLWAAQELCMRRTLILREAFWYEPYCCPDFTDNKTKA